MIKFCFILALHSVLTFWNQGCTTEYQCPTYTKAPPALYQSINLQVWRCCSVPPFVDLLCDHSAAERTALLPVEPQRDAFITEYVLHIRKTTAYHVLLSQ